MAKSLAKPPMKQRILETADRLFYGRGIRAVGVDTVAAEIGISKRTLYNHFPSKDALVLAYLERRLRPLPASDRPPLEQVLGAFDRLGRSFGAAEFRGCAFVNAVTELGEENAAARGLAIEFKEARRLWFRGLLDRLGVADPDGLATQLALLVDGAIAAFLVRRDPAVALAAKDAAMALLAQAGARQTPADR
jgi:AcrR family transcriptional regulator